MAIFKDTIKIKDPLDRAVQLTVRAPADRNIPNLQVAAKRAWHAPGEAITVGEVAVKVRAISR